MDIMDKAGKVGSNEKQEDMKQASTKNLEPKIIADLRPKVMWSRQYCGTKPCKGEYS